MGSSPGFVSTPCHCTFDRPLQTRFPCGSGCHCLNLATKSNSLAHSPKGTPSALRLPKSMVLRPLVSTRFQVLFHSPHRGSFHLSLTVLVRYRSPRVFSLGQWSALLPTGFLVPRGTQGHRQQESVRFRLPGLSPSLVDLSSALRLACRLLTPVECCSIPARPPTTPTVQRSQSATTQSGLGCSPFARHYSGNPLFSCGY